MRFPIDDMLRELKTRFRGSSLRAALATALAVVAAGCGGEVPLVSPEGATLSINANPTVIPIINGESTITVVAFKAPEDGGGTVADGTQIFFSTSVGVIEERVETRSGIARATLRSNGRAGTATITASSGSGITATLENGVLIGNGEGVNIVLTANPATVVSPDFTSDLTATAFDNANNPLRDVPILFTTTAGVLASRGSILRTNANGQATDRLTLLTESSASVTAISGAISSNSVTVSRGTASEPVLTSLSPFTGAQGQTLTVTLNGLNFQPGAAASFGEGIAVQDVDFVAPTALRARITISPAATDGARTVTVTNPDGGTATLADGFLVTAGGGGGGVGGVSVVSVSPSDANQGDNLNVTIIGTNFQAGATVGFGAGITVNSVSFVSATELDADITVSLAAAGGPRTVTVVNPDASSGSLAAGFTVIAPPIVSSVTPTNGDPGTSITVSVGGANFQNGATVDFGAGMTVDQVFFVDPTDLSVDITIDLLAAPGVRAVTVTNPDGGSDTLAIGFTVN